MQEDMLEILKGALKLPPEARAALAGTLLDSLDQEIDQEAESAWEDEIAKRLEAIATGLVRMTPWSEARGQIAER